MFDTLLHILMILGSLGLFLYGMRILSEATQKLAGGDLRRLLRGITTSPLQGVMSGSIITGVIQSSSAMTILIVSMVHAGLLQLRRAMALIMGANIGTTLTIWLVVLFGFSFEISTIALPLIGLSFPLTLIRRNAIQSSATAFLGLAILLLALGLLKSELDPWSENQRIIDLIGSLSIHERWAPLLYFGVGALITAIFQSSSLMVTLSVVLTAGGVIPFEGALAMIVGKNLGTTVTANIAAIITNTEAKRAALFHTLFNVVGACWALPLLVPISYGIQWLVGGAVAPLTPEQEPLALALFHTLFNVLNTTLLVGLIPQFERFLRWLLPDKEGVERSRVEASDEFSAPLIATSELRLFQAQEGMKRYVADSQALFALAQSYFRELNAEQSEALLQQISSRREQIEQRRVEMTQTLNGIAQDEVSPASRRQLHQLYLLSGELHTIIRYEVGLINTLRRKRRRNIWFDPETRTQTLTLFDRIRLQISGVMLSLESDKRRHPSLLEAERQQREVHELIDEHREAALAPQHERELTAEAQLIFSELLEVIDMLSEALAQATINNLSTHSSPHERHPKR